MKISDVIVMIISRVKFIGQILRKSDYFYNHNNNVWKTFREKNKKRWRLCLVSIRNSEEQTRPWRLTAVVSIEKTLNKNMKHINM